MWHILYKGFIVSGEFDKEDCRIFAGEVKGQSYKWDCKSLLAAKQKITRMIKAGTKPPDL